MICPHCLYEQERPGSACESCGRPHAVTGDPLPPLVGRARELARLADELDGVVKNRVPRVVGLVGGARVGTSRLLAEFRRRHDNEFSDIGFLRGHPTPGGAAVDPFLPFGRLLRNALRLDDALPPHENAARAREAVDAIAPPSLPDTLRALGYFLGLRFEEILFAEPPVAGPDEERRRAFAWFAWFLRQRAERRPLVVLLEGLHDATPEGLDLLEFLHHHVAGVPLLMLCEVHRERFGTDPGFFLRFGDGVVELEALGREAVGELLMKLTDRATPPPPNLLEAVMAATSGYPEAVAQVAASLRGHGVVHPERIGWGVDPDSETLLFDFPLSADDEARRRLGLLEPEDRVWLRRAAVVGTVFWRGVLTPLARMDQGQTLGHWIDFPEPGVVEEALDRAEAEGILHGMGDSALPGEAEYAFTRAREQQLLVEELGPDERAAMHAIIAQWLEYQPGPERDNHLWQVAEHARRAGNDKRAAFYYIRAGDRARRRFANDLAIEAFERALSLLDHRDALPLMDVLHALGALHALDGRHDRAERAFERMLSLAWSLDHKAKAGAALNRLGRLYRDRCRYDRAAALLQRGRELFARADDGAGVAASLDDLGQVALRQGERELALSLFEEALAYRRSVDDPRSVALSLTNLAQVHRDLGRLLTAESRLREGLDLRQRIEDAVGIVSSRLALAELNALRGETDAAWREANEALGLARRIGDRGQAARALALSALLLAEQGAFDTARVEAEEAAALAEQLGDLNARLQALRALGMALSTTEPERALATLESAARLARQHDARLEHGLSMRFVGALHTRLSGVDVHAHAALVRDRREAVAADSAEASVSTERNSIDLLIDDALKDPEPDSQLALTPEARTRLDQAIEAYGDAITVLEAIHPEQETINALREMAIIVEAAGDVSRARTLERRARKIAAARRDRLLQDAE